MADVMIPPTLANLQVIAPLRRSPLIAGVLPPSSRAHPPPSPPSHRPSPLRTFSMPLPFAVDPDTIQLQNARRARMVELRDVIVQEENEYKSLSEEIMILETSPPSPTTLKTTYASYLAANPRARPQPKRRRNSDSVSLSDEDAQGEDMDDYDGMGDERMDGVDDDERTQAEGDGVANYLLDVPDEDDENDEGSAAADNSGMDLEDAEGLEDLPSTKGRMEVITVDDSSEDGEGTPAPPSDLNGLVDADLAPPPDKLQPEVPGSSSKPLSSSHANAPAPSSNQAYLYPPPSTALDQNSSTADATVTASQGSNQTVIPATPSPPPAASATQPPADATAIAVLSSGATPSSSKPVEAPSNGPNGYEKKDAALSPSSSSGLSSDGEDDQASRGGAASAYVKEVVAVDGLFDASALSQLSPSAKPNSRSRVVASSDPHAADSPSASSSALPTTTTTRSRSKPPSASSEVKTRLRSSASPAASSRHDPSHRAGPHADEARPEGLVDVVEEDGAADGEGLPSDHKDSTERPAVKERKARSELAKAKRIEDIREGARRTVERDDPDAEGEEDDAAMDVDREEELAGVKLEEVDESVLGDVEEREESIFASTRRFAKDKGKGKEVAKKDPTEDVEMDVEGEDDEDDGTPAAEEEVVIPQEQRKGRSRSSLAVLELASAKAANKGRGHPKGKMPPKTLAALVASESSTKDSLSEDEDLDEEGSFVDGDDLTDRASQISRNSAAPSVATSAGTSDRRNKNGTKQKTTKQRQDDKAAGLSATAAQELQEKRNSDRRVRDRARREKEKAAKKEKEDEEAKADAEAEEAEDEDGTPAKRSNKKRKVAQGKNKSPAPDADRVTKKRREEASATPEVGHRSSSRQASRQPSSSRPPANSQPPTSFRSASLPPPAPNPQLPLKQFKKAIDLLLSGIAQYRSSGLFNAPIKDADAPNYSKTVLRPMDLRTIKSKIKDGSISNVDEFERDILLMFTNAMLYNEPSTEVHRMAEEMMGEADKQIREWRHLQWRLLHQNGEQ